MNTEPATNDARAKFRILLTTSLVSSLIVLDTNIVAVSLPAIGQSLGASFTDIEWVVSAYLLSYASLLMGAGAYADSQHASAYLSTAADHARALYSLWLPR